MQTMGHPCYMPKKISVGLSAKPPHSPMHSQKESQKKNKLVGLQSQKKQTNKQANQQTSKPTNQQTNQPTNQQTNQQTNQPINQQTNKQQTNINLIGLKCGYLQESSKNVCNMDIHFDWQACDSRVKMYVSLARWLDFALQGSKKKH